jgi:hypothetical protein
MAAKEKEDTEQDRTTVKEKADTEKDRLTVKEKEVVTIFLMKERVKGKGKGAMMTTITLGRVKGKERGKARAKVKDQFILQYLLVPTYRHLHQRYIQTFPRRLLSTLFDQLVRTEH